MARDTLPFSRAESLGEFGKSTPVLTFDDTFTVSSGTGTVSYLTGVHGATAVGLNKTGTGQVNVDCDTAINVTIDSADSGVDFLSVFLNAYESGSADYVRVLLGQGGFATSSIAKAFFAPDKGEGWTTLRQSADWVSWTGTPTYPFVADSLRVQFIGNKLGHRFFVDALFGPSFDNQTDGYVCFTFDDGYDTDFTVAKDILAAYGYVGTSFIIEDETVASPLTLAQRQGLVDAGWEIGCHHQTNLSTLTQSQAREEMGGCCAYINDTGVPFPTSMSWPLSTVDEAAYRGVAETPILYGRIGPWETGYGLTPIGTKAQNRLLFPADALYYNTVDAIKLQMDAAREKGMGLITTSHRVFDGAGTDHVSPAQLEEAVAYAASLGLKGLTFSQFARKFGYKL